MHPRGTRPKLQDSISRNRGVWLRLGVDPYPELRKMVALKMGGQAPIDSAYDLNAEARRRAEFLKR